MYLRFRKVAFLASQGLKVAFLNSGFMKVAFLNPWDGHGVGRAGGVEVRVRVRRG